ncbi:hypothetical protein BDQ12DRAFT_691611 [Crucibulum laeve]|uniref:Uncharacterized protein n=1 Tax=Crucibulum laeve TaxID=68775 RepID=A0A5C3LJ18_9AGAR|nr:hypothetical protein BDQ12DRAFT_691611 [Crucibulum laeve]
MSVLNILLRCGIFGGLFLVIFVILILCRCIIILHQWPADEGMMLVANGLSKIFFLAVLSSESALFKL